MGGAIGKRKGTDKARPELALPAQRLRVALAYEGWSAATLASKLGVSRQAASAWTRAEAQPSADEAARMPGLLGVEPDWLFPKATAIATTGPRRPATGRVGGQAGVVGLEGVRPQRGPQGFILREITATDVTLRAQVSRVGADFAALAALLTNQAAQMIADRVARVFRQTFEENESSDTRAGRTFTIAFLERVVAELGAPPYGLNMTDVARYIIELRKENDDQATTP